MFIASSEHHQQRARETIKGAHYCNHEVMGPSHVANIYMAAIQVDGVPRGRDGPKRPWMEVVKIDLKKYNLYEDLTQ